MPTFEQFPFKNKGGQFIQYFQQILQYYVVLFIYHDPKLVSLSESVNDMTSWNHFNQKKNECFKCSVSFHVLTYATSLDGPLQDPAHQVSSSPCIVYIRALYVSVGQNEPWRSAF